MRSAAFALALCAVGCNDYDVLRTDFCTSALAAGAHPRAALCDDFEQPAGEINGTLWTVPASGATTIKPTEEPGASLGVNPDGTPSNAYRGDWTAYLSAPLSEEQKTATLYSPTASGGAYALRMFAYFDVLPPGHVELVTLQDGAGNVRYQLSLEEGILALTEITDLGPTAVPPPRVVNLPGQVGAGVWLCLELDVSNGVSGASTHPPELDLSIMDVLVASIRALTLPPAIAKTLLGPSRGMGVANSNNVWIDEVVLANKHIGCEE